MKNGVVTFSLKYERQPHPLRKNSCEVIMKTLDKTTSLRAFSLKACTFGEILMDSHMFVKFLYRGVIFIKFLPKMRRCIHYEC